MGVMIVRAATTFSPSGSLRAPVPSSRPRWWEWPAVLSLEAPAVAVSWQGLLAHVFDTALPSGHVALLASSVWLAYVADRWMDALGRFGKGRSRERLETRHVYLAERAGRVALLWGVILLSALALAWRTLDSGELTRGLVLAGGVAAYLVTVRLGWVVGKHLQVGLLFAVGVGLFSVGSAAWPRALPALLCFGGLCWLNSALIAHWEARAEGPPATPPSRSLALLLSCIGLAAAGAVLVGTGEAEIGTSVVLSALGLLGVHLRGERVTSQRLHALVDAVLLSPLVILLLALLGTGSSGVSG